MNVSKFLISYIAILKNSVSLLIVDMLDIYEKNNKIWLSMI